MKEFDIDKLKLNHRKKSAYCINLVAISVCFIYSLVVASSILLFPKTGLSDSYLIAKNATILAAGLLILCGFAYKYLSSIASINKSL